jgi:uncharacterized repeat protein (TIGR04138 family)
MARAAPVKLLQEVVDEVGIYPPEAYLFVQQGLAFTVQRIHAKVSDPKASRHVSGRDLCEGLRELALQQWGLLARVVLTKWNITSTLDFGRLVFAMVRYDLMQKTDQDSLDDFKGVYDFRTALEATYKIEPSTPGERTRRAEKTS